jgi:alpha-beta hydrolase superfamily lysophospholipase
MRSTPMTAICASLAMLGGDACTPAIPAAPRPVTPNEVVPSATQVQMEQMRRMFVGRRPELDSMRRRPADLGLEWQRFEALNPHGTRIAGWWLPAKSAKATIVMVHGANQNKASMLGRAASLVAEGFNVGVIDLRARGESGGEESELGPEAGTDVIAATNALIASHRHHDVPLIGYGFSHGARTVLFAAAQSPVIDAVIAEAPPKSIAEGLQRQLMLPVAPILPEGNLDSAFIALRRRPVLVLVGDSDPELSAGQAKIFLTGNTAPGSALVVFPKTGHGVFNEANRARYVDAVSAFVSILRNR